MDTKIKTIEIPEVLEIEQKKDSVYDPNFVKLSYAEINSYLDKLAGMNGKQEELKPQNIAEIKRDIQRIREGIKSQGFLKRDQLPPQQKLIRLREDLVDALSQIENEEKRLNINIDNEASPDSDYIKEQRNLVGNIKSQIKFAKQNSEDLN